ncbi:hypothetical protein ERO13_D07G166250v2 [Gossypium hirsutum]|nr:hypothetical protein ERO13_D07G166250v2 [Gossypium hirsutum]
MDFLRVPLGCRMQSINIHQLCGNKLVGQFFNPVEKHFYTQKCFWVKSNEEHTSFGASRLTSLKYFWADEKAENFCFFGQKVLLSWSFTFLAPHTNYCCFLAGLLLLCSHLFSCWFFVPLLLLCSSSSTASLFFYWC